MSNHADFLVEIQTEELPPKTLRRLEMAFLQEIEARLRKAELSFTQSHSFATPRRLAVLITHLSPKQPDTEVERKGPSLEAAFDKNGKPTPACIGFAKSCSVTPDQLKQIKTEAGTWVGFLQKNTGKSVQELLPEIVKQALAALPIAKRMRWGSGSEEFVRPVHSVILLYGTEIIDAEILGCKSGNQTSGHRFLSKGLITIKKPADYAKALHKGHVIADFEERKKIIREEAEAIAKKIGIADARALITENLLEEVTGLVEWPVAICGQFDKPFLEVPQEALISAMQDHQRYFPVVNKENKLLPFFITMSNIESKNVNQVISGNERVLRARLSDAAFFYEVDKKYSLSDRINNLKNVTFQAKLGNMLSKATRLAGLAAFISDKMNLCKEELELAARAGMLAKADLTTELVGEFPELQGIAGYYYAKNDEENESIAIALKEQYLPRFSGDVLPSTQFGIALALADRVDTLIGIFGINQQPTGDKDPFGLRRASLGILRILIEKEMHLDLRELFEEAKENYEKVSLPNKSPIENNNVVDEVLTFTLDRLKPWYSEQNISADVIAAVAALNITDPFDFHSRVQAVQNFKRLPAADSLSIANKRVSNILAKYNETIALSDVDEKLFESDVERELSKSIKAQIDAIQSLSQSGQYQELLTELAALREPVDSFFDTVLVMTEDKRIRENRLLLLKKLRELFLHVADIALLQ